MSYLQLKLASQMPQSGRTGDLHPRTAPWTSPESQAARLAAARPLQWMHVPKSGSSFMNALKYLPGMCPFMPPGVLSATGPQGSFTYWYLADLCPGSFSETGRLYYSDHSGLGPLYNLSDIAPPLSLKGHGVVMLRQPEQRIISAYLYHQHSWPTWYFGRRAANLTEFAHVVSGCAVRMLTRGGEASHLGHGPCGSPLPATGAEVTLAKERLREGFAFVGITDEWDMSICLLHAVFGGSCLASDFDVMNPGTNHSSDPYDTSELMGYTDAADGALYEEALTIFSEEMQRYGVSYESCQPCFRQASSSSVTSLPNAL